MEEWKEYKLGEILCEKGYIRGPFGSALKRGDMLNEGIPVYEQQHAIYGKRDFRYYISKDKYEEMKRFTVYPGDILISCSGTIGEVSIIKEEDLKGIISQALLLLRPKKEVVTPEFLLYFFRTPQGHNSITSRSSGSVQVNIARRDVIEQIPLYLPHRKMQNRIVSILKSLDDKIEVNRRINENLEQQAQALFKSWFVDFEPFRDQPFVESELGMIPKEWRVGTIGELCSLVSGFAFQSCTYVDKGLYRLVTIKNVQDGYLNSDGAVCLNEVPSRMPIHCLLKIGDILLSLTGNVGRCCFVNEKRLLLNQRVAKIIPNKDSFWGYIYTFFRNEDIKTLLMSIAKGTAQANLSPVETLKLTTIVPTNEVIEKFSKIVNSLYEEFIKNTIESRRLAQLRDTLLPRLMSGKIKVGDVTL